MTALHQFIHWRAALQAAATTAQVQELMEQYSSRIAPGDKMGLPAACKSVLRDVEIATGAATLIREELLYEGDAATADLLHEIAHTFVAAANRLALLESSG